MRVKKIVILALLVSIIFAGGFFAGVFYTSKQTGTNIAYNPPRPAAGSEKALQDKEVPKPAHPAVLIGYVQDFRNPDTIDYSNMTHAIFSFAHPLEDGSVLLNGGMAEENLRKTVKLAHASNTKVILGIGGWFHIKGGDSYPYFKKAIGNPVSRSKLVNGLIELVNKENLDGIDIDFEHPRSETDAQNLAAFASELAARLHPQKKELSVAVYSKINAVTGAEVASVIFKPEMFSAADHVNIMAYDGQWDGGYNAANLAPYQFTENIVTYWSGLFDRLGLPKEKLVLGVPLYGQPLNPKIKQVSYSAILKNDPANAFRDAIEMNGTTYFYNGEKTARKKAILALENGFGGMMLWEAGLDSEGNASMARALRGTIEQYSLTATSQ